MLKVSQEHVNSLLWMLPKSVTSLDFRISQGSVATYCRRGGNIYRVYIHNFLRNKLVKEFWNSVYTCQSYYQTSTCALSWLCVQGAPIKKQSPRKNSIYPDCSRFFHQIYNVYRRGFRPHIQQISLKYMVWVKNYKYLNLKVHFFLTEQVMKLQFWHKNNSADI